MRQLALIATVLVCACSKGRLGGLVADVTLLDKVQASCIDVKVSDTSGKQLGESLVVTGGKRMLRIGIGSEGYPQDVVISVTPMWSANGCTTPKLNGAAVEHPGQFPYGKTADVMFQLAPPDSTLDADGDGFVGIAKGGADCDDANASAHPGAMEDCSTLLDLDCNQLSGCADPACTTVAGCAMPADHLVFITAAQTLDTNACSDPLTVESRGPSGTAAPLPSGTPVGFSAQPAAGVRFFSDPTCLTEVTQVSASMPLSRFTVFFQAAMSGSIVVTAASPMLNAATQTQTVRPPAASQIAFSSPARVVVAGSCSEFIDVEARDSAGGARPVLADVLVSLQVTPTAAVTFHTDSSCTTAAISTATITTGTSATRFYSKGLIAGDTVISGSAAGFNTTTQPLTVSAGPAVQLAFVTSAQGIARSTCSGITSVRAEDALGNPAALAANATLDLSETGVAGITLHSDPACANAITTAPLAAAAGSLASFYFKGTTMGAATLTASVDGGMPALASATQVENIGVGPPSLLSFTTPLHTVVADTCSPAVTVEVRDTSMFPVNPPTPISVLLDGAPDAGFTVYTDSSCATPLVGPLMISGSPSATFRFKAQHVPAQRIDARAMAPATLMPDSQVHTVLPAAANRLSITTPPRAAVAGVCSPTVHVEVQDAFGNAAPVTNLPVGFSTASPQATFHGAAAGCTAAAPAMVTTGDAGFDFRFIGIQPGPMPLTVSSSGGVAAAMQTEQVDAGPPSVLAFITAGRTQPAGVCSATPLTVVTRDSVGNQVPLTSPMMVNLAADDGGIAFSPAAGCSGAGVAGVILTASSSSADFWFTGKKAGLANITASAAGFTSATQGQTVTPGDAKVIAITSPQRTTQVDVCSPQPVTFETRDTFGNAAALSTPISFSVDGGASLQGFGAPACTTPVPGVSLAAGASAGAFYVKASVAGMVPVFVSAAGFTGATDTVVVMPGPTQLVFTTSVPPLYYAGQCSPVVTVQARDPSNNPVTLGVAATVTPTPTTGFTFYSDINCTTPVTSLSIAAGSSSQSFWFRGITGGSTMLQATSPGLTAASQSITVIPAVRTGTCTIAANQYASTNCMISPGLENMNHSIIINQALPAPNNASAPDMLVRCHLTSATSLVCERGGNGNVAVTSMWQTFTWPSAAQVQHLSQVQCLGDSTDVTVNDMGPVDGGGNAFVLHSVSTISGQADRDENDTVTLSSPTHVVLAHSGNACLSTPVHDLQVVQLSGAIVTPGTSQFSSNTQVNSPTLATGNVSRSMVLYSWDTTTTGTDVCERLVRGFVSSATDVQFNRALGSQGQCTNGGVSNIAFQRVEFPPGAQVQTVTLDIADGAMSGTASVAAVDVTRTLLMTGSVTHNMTALGETNINNSPNLDNYVGHFSIDATGTTVTAARIGNTGPVRYSVFVIELDPR
jgi:hypothetical protein